MIVERRQTQAIFVAKDLTQHAHLIREPKLTSLAKFSLSFFAEMSLQQKAVQAWYAKQQLGSQRAPVKDVNGNLITGPGNKSKIEGNYIKKWDQHHISKIQSG